MNFETLNDYLKRKPIVNLKSIPAWHCLRYTVNDMLFALVETLPNGRPAVTLKFSTRELLQARQKYPDIILPAFSLEPLHWNTLYLDGDLPDGELFRYINRSYALVSGENTNVVIYRNGNANASYAAQRNEFDFAPLFSKFSYPDKSED